ncbi:MAG: VOC family protein [Oscillospiraceae bacterium]
MIEPYLYFNGKCAEAIDFYEKVFAGGEKRIMLYKDMPQSPENPVSDDMKEQVLHAELLINGTRVNFSDVQEKSISGNMISFAARFGRSDDVVRAFNQLKEGGEVRMELGRQFFSPMYGWIEDKYGIGWQLICE